MRKHTLAAFVVFPRSQSLTERDPQNLPSVPLSVAEGNRTCPPFGGQVQTADVSTRFPQGCSIGHFPRGRESHPNAKWSADSTQASGGVCAATALRQTQHRCSSPATRNRIATARSVHAHASASTRAGVPPNRTHASTVAGCGSFVIGRRSNSSSLPVSVSRRPDFARRSKMRWSIRLSICSAYRRFVVTAPGTSLPANTSTLPRIESMFYSGMS